MYVIILSNAYVRIRLSFCFGLTIQLGAVNEVEAVQETSSGEATELVVGIKTNSASIFCNIAPDLQRMDVAVLYNEVEAVQESSAGGRCSLLITGAEGYITCNLSVRF